MLQDVRNHRGLLRICKSSRNNRGLQARRVSKAWLETYLNGGEQAAIAKLSVFAGSFSAEGASAVMAETGASQQASYGLVIRSIILECKARDKLQGLVSAMHVLTAYP